MMRSFARVLLLLALTVLASAHAAIVPPQAPADAAEDAFWWGDFAALERQNATLQLAGAVDGDGTCQLAQFRTGLDIIFNDDRSDTELYLQELDRVTLEWATAHPASAFAHILHAHALARHGWSYRGNGGMAQVPPEAGKQFYAYEKQALDYLNAHADVALRDSYAQVVLLEIGTALLWTDKQLDAVAQQGLARNPGDMGIYFARMEALLPKWDGSAKALDDYIQQSTEALRPRMGMAMYARLYSAAAQEYYGHALFTGSHANWDKMKQGFTDILARYPDSARWRNRYAYMACLAKDKPALRTQLGLLDTRVDAGQWGPNGKRSLEGCQRWATSE